ncbi:MAG: tRNA (adenosine(37)-N6)-threonylcarbamoyltransferase complex transferase subunit TsaD [Planctomycetota bacterium]
MTLVLGIETSCDETAAAVVEDGKIVRSNVVASQHELHAEYMGVVPEVASRAHVEAILPIIRRALHDADLTLADIDAIAVGHRPGLIGSLLIGVAAAKALSWSLGIPLIAVDHVHAHLYAGFLRDAPPADNIEMPHTFPALGLVVSGGHTSIYRIDAHWQLTRVGATIDDAIGEAFDKAATMLGLPYPGGPNLDRLARTDNANDRAFDLPISRLGRDSLDMSFSGLKTAVLYAIKGRPNRDGSYDRSLDDMPPDQRRDLAASFQRAAVRAVILKLERALDSNTACSAIVAGGGVTANSRLRSELAALAERRSLPLVIPAMDYCMDNAAMIAGLGSVRLAEGERATLDLAPVPTTAC